MRCLTCDAVLTATDAHADDFECAACTAEQDAMCAMSEEQLVLHLARAGISPLDCEAGLKRLHSEMDSMLDEMKKGKP